MTMFERFALPHGAQEIEAALEAAFRRFHLDVPTCQLVGAQNNTLIEVVVQVGGRSAFRFKVALEDIVDHSLAGKIDLALRAAVGTPEVM